MEKQYYNAFKEIIWEVWTELIWLRIGTSSEFL
jgi:hypothetical protein